MIALAGGTNVYAADRIDRSDSLPVGSKIEITVDSDPFTIGSSDSRVATARQIGTDGVEIDGNGVGSASITIGGRNRSQTISVTVTDRAPAVLDTTNCVAAMGSAYSFTATTSADDLSAPVPESSDASVARVSFVKRISVGKYLYRADALKKGSAFVGVRIGDSDSEVSHGGKGFQSHCGPPFASKAGTGFRM